jgi:hypothetical protein
MSRGSSEEYPTYTQVVDMPALEMAILALLERCAKVDAPWVCEVTRCTLKQAVGALRGLAADGFVHPDGQSYVRDQEHFLNNMVWRERLKRRGIDLSLPDTPGGRAWTR